MKEIVYTYYDRNILLPGTANKMISAKLTYGLDPKPTAERTLLLTAYHRQFLSAEMTTYWELLIRETNHISTGNFTQDKSLVKKIRDYPNLFPYFGVAVHHFGPVPVLLTDYYYDLELHGKEVKAQVAIYFSRANESGDQFLSIFPNKAIFLQSLTNTYDVVMQRYFEDVAQVFKSIAIQSSLSQTFELCKLAEDYIGQSIQSKLKDSIPSVPEWKSFNKFSTRNLTSEVLAKCILFEEHYADIFLAQQFRYTALYFINELYRHLGLESRSNDYLAKIEQSYYDYDELQGHGNSKELLDYILDLRILHQTRRIYQQNSADSLSKTHSNVIWLQGMIEFARFLLMLNQNYVAPEKGRIFISYSYQSQQSEYLKEQIANYYEEHNKTNIEVLSTENLPAGSAILDVIKARIWQADRVLVIIHKLNEKTSESNYDWLARECEHAMLLDKEITFLLGYGYDSEVLEKSLGNESIVYLAAEAKTDYPRAQHLLANFRQRNHLLLEPPSYTLISTWKDLNERIQVALQHTATTAIEIRHYNLIRGYLSQFSEDTLITLKCLNKLLSTENSLSKDEIVEYLHKEFGAKSYLPFSTMSKARNLFKNTWNSTRSRSLSVKNRVFKLLTIEKNRNRHYYSLNLGSLIKALKPEISINDIQTLSEKLLNEVVPERAKDF